MARLVAEAAERRQFQRPTRTSQANSSKVYEDHDRDLEERLKLRRMINKIVEADGIPSLRVRNWSTFVYLPSVQLLKLS